MTWYELKEAIDKMPNNQQAMPVLVEMQDNGITTHPELYLMQLETGIKCPVLSFKIREDVIFQ